MSVFQGKNDAVWALDAEKQALVVRINEINLIKDTR